MSLRIHTALVVIPLSCAASVLAAAAPNLSRFGLTSTIRRHVPIIRHHHAFAPKSQSVPPVGEGRIFSTPLYLHLRGGGGGGATSNANTDQHGGQTSIEQSSDEDRYSRQVYTLGARAHALVRSTTVVIDGPAQSGLLYECGKNLALSGVGSVVILMDDNKESRDVHAAYHHAPLDDLGNAYQNAARAETGIDVAKEGLEELAAEYLRRLNPSLKVTLMKRSEFLAMCYGEDSSGGSKDQDVLGTNPVFMSVDRPQSTQLVLNDACRRRRGRTIPFVSVETAGVFTRTFCDFGPTFTVVDEDGETPKETLLDRIELATEENDRKGAEEADDVFVVHCLEDERHEVSKGDQIVFQKGAEFAEEDDGSEESSNQDNDLGRCEVLRVMNPTRFTVRRICSDDSGAEDYAHRVNHDALSFSRVKVPREVEFLSLWKALEAQADADKDIFAASDLEKSLDMTRRSAVMASFSALDSFAHEYERLPAALVGDDIAIFKNMAKQAAMGDKKTDKAFSAIVERFCRCSKAKLAPVQALCGALGAQEALKAASGLYNPIKQFLLYDCEELLHKVKGAGEEDAKGCYGAAGQTYALGKTLTKKLASQKVFVVGSGAIGCEILKNLSAMGAGTRKSKGGKIILTDMDTIEKSNLSRQLLFRDVDVGKFKSSAAQEAILRFNPNVHIDAHTSKVGDDAEGGAFDDSFWSEGIDTILNALDNVDARLYMDSQCVAHRKGLVDAGTLGAKGNVQVVVPGLSESYGSSVDPPEPAIPVCTLKNFPYEISHTIQWGRDLFDGLFNKRPSQINDNAETLASGSTADFARQLVHNLGDDAALEAAEEMGEDYMIKSNGENAAHFVERVKYASIAWAINLAHKLFNKSVQDLLRQHPLDSVDEDGEPFWTGTRRAPKVLSYNDAGEVSSEHCAVNEHLVDFVRTAARLRAENYLPQDGSAEELISADDAVNALVSFDRSSGGTDTSTSSDDNDTAARVSGLLNGEKEWSKQILPLNPAEFEKDDDANGHVAFVAAASNLRALCYGIKPVDAMETRRVAGRIVPAMITTTAFVSALSCIELLKLLQKAPLTLHRNAFVNLALPFFAFTSPMPAEEFEGYRGESHTVWDRMVLREGKKSGGRGGLKLSRFLKDVRKQLASEDGETPEIATISYGPYMLYANFLHDGDEDILRQSMTALVKDAVISGDDIDDDFMSDDEGDGGGEAEVELTKEQQADVEQIERRSFFDFSVIVEDPETGEEVELPPVRLVRWKSDDAE
mmetsp:Transcript_22065/g.48077  ORF Transcript_22065/g.48077 Transcript_22065/m.48077 type:complete len:1256 (+) Transcript_22065:79-3846(+)